MEYAFCDRRQVTSYVPFTKRLPMVEEFTPEESVDRLYNLVSDYQRATHSLKTGNSSPSGPMRAFGSAIRFPFCLVSAVPETMIYHLNQRPNWDLKCTTN